MSFVEAETEARNGDIIHVYDDPSYLELRKHEREMQASIKALQAENAKLQELVRDMLHELDAVTQYDAGGGRGAVDEFAARMRELGIEVDE